MRLKHIFQTHEGMIRDHNEDNFTIVFGAEFGGVGEAPTFFEPDEKGTVLMVADGMGGMNAGEEASRLAVEAVNEYFEGLGDVSEDQVAVHMKRVCIEANNRIVEHAKKFPETKGMGTTIVVAWLRDEAAHIGWVGDSRAYLLRKGTLKEVTKDHSLVQEWVDEGKINKEQAFYHPQNNIVTQSLGSPSDAIRPDYIKEPLASGDQLLLCSDGLNGMLLDPDIEQIMRAGGHDIKMTADRLIKAANDKGGKDNITVILADIEEAEGVVVLEEPVAASALADTAETGITRTGALKGRISKLERTLLIIVIVAALVIGGIIAFFIFNKNREVPDSIKEEILQENTETINKKNSIHGDLPSEDQEVIVKEEPKQRNRVKEINEPVTPSAEDIHSENLQNRSHQGDNKSEEDSTKNGFSSKSDNFEGVLNSRRKDLNKIPKPGELADEKKKLESKEVIRPAISYDKKGRIQIKSKSGIQVVKFDENYKVYKKNEKKSSEDILVFDLFKEEDSSDGIRVEFDRNGEQIGKRKKVQKQKSK